MRNHWEIYYCLDFCDILTGDELNSLRRSQKDNKCFCQKRTACLCFLIAGREAPGRADSVTANLLVHFSALWTCWIECCGGSCWNVRIEASSEPLPMRNMFRPWLPRSSGMELSIQLCRALRIKDFTPLDWSEKETLGVQRHLFLREFSLYYLC